MTRTVCHRLWLLRVPWSGPRNAIDVRHVGDFEPPEIPEELRGTGRYTVAIVTVATLATAWCAFQSTLWGGRQAFAIVETMGAQMRATEAHLISNQHSMLDIATFIQYHESEHQGDTETAQFYRESFRPIMKRAFEAWTYARQQDPEGAPHTPFTMPEYERAETRHGDDLLEQSSRSGQRAMAYNSTSDNYAMMTVLLSASSSLAGLSEKLARKRARRVLSVFSLLVLFGSLLWIISLPIAFAD